MKHKKIITLLVIVIAAFSSIAAAAGVFSAWSEPAEQIQIQSLYGEKITLYGKGIYRNDSESAAAQAVAQDVVTLILAVPMLLISLTMARRGLLKGKLLLTGTLGYFLYTYTSYTFLCIYNSLFLIYVMLMSVSLFTFILCITYLDMEALKNSFNTNLSVKFIGGFQLFLAFMIFTLWMGRIVPSLVEGSVPFGLEHYSTLVIQALDLGIIVPATVLSGIMILRRKTLGYLLSSVIIIKGLTMLTALTAMIAGMIIAGVEVSIVEIFVFPAFNLIAIFCLVVLLRSINEKAYISKTSNYTA